MVALKDYRYDFRLSLIESETNDWAYKFNDGFRYGILLDGKLVYKSNCKDEIEGVFNSIKDTIVECRKEVLENIPCVSDIV